MLLAPALGHFFTMSTNAEMKNIDYRINKRTTESSLLVKLASLCRASNQYSVNAKNGLKAQLLDDRGVPHSDGTVDYHSIENQILAGIIVKLCSGENLSIQDAIAEIRRNQPNILTGENYEFLDGTDKIFNIRQTRSFAEVTSGDLGSTLKLRCMEATVSAIAIAARCLLIRLGDNPEPMSAQAQKGFLMTEVNRLASDWQMSKKEEVQAIIDKIFQVDSEDPTGMRVSLELSPDLADLDRLRAEKDCARNSINQPVPVNYQMV